VVDKGYHGPLFIIGMPRSGTKLLRGLLNQHQLIGIPPSETEFLPWLIKCFPDFGDISDRALFHDFYKVMLGIHYFQRMHEEGCLIEEAVWYDSCLEFTPAGVFEALIRHDSGIDSTVGIWGDKSPSYIGHVELLKGLFPEARFVHIVRDVRDYCLSMNSAWGKSMLRAAQRWFDYISIVQRVQRIYPDSILSLRYEDLLDDPECELRRVCLFLEIEYQESMSVLSKSVENLGDATNISTIKKDNKYKYMQKMKNSTRIHIESLSWPLLQEWGYTYGYDGPVKRLSPLRLKVLQVFDAFSLFRFHIEERGLTKGVLVMLKLYSTSGNRENS